MEGWVCVCGHNRSFHAYEQNRFRGGWDTYCKAQEYGMSGSDRCPCSEFRSEEVTA